MVMKSFCNRNTEVKHTTKPHAIPFGLVTDFNKRKIKVRPHCAKLEYEFLMKWFLTENPAK